MKVWNLFDGDWRATIDRNRELFLNQAGDELVEAFLIPPSGTPDTLVELSEEESESIPDWLNVPKSSLLGLS